MEPSSGTCNDQTPDITTINNSHKDDEHSIYYCDDNLVSLCFSQTLMDSYVNRYLFVDANNETE